jgi:hypothetical protein
MAKKKIPTKYLPWIEARKRFHLSDAHIQMARELGLNPNNTSSVEFRECADAAPCASEASAASDKREKGEP